MDDFFSFISGDLSWQDLPSELPVEVLFFSVLVFGFSSIFHTLVVRHLLGFRKFPTWLLPVIYLSLVLNIWFIKPGLLELLMFPVVIFTIVFFVFSFLLLLIISFSKSLHTIFKQWQENGFVFKWKTFLKSAIGIFFFLSSLVFLTFPGFFLLLFFIFFLLLGFWVSRKKRRILNLQASLPTSKLCWTRVGLAELKGRVLMQKSLLTPIEKKDCIAYRYIVEKISFRKGQPSYTKISEEFKCNEFILKDDTGEAQVRSDKIEFMLFEEDCSIIDDEMGHRHTQYVLYPNQEVLLIGKVKKENFKPIVEYDSDNDVFAVFPFESLSTYNSYKPILNSFILFSSVFFLLVLFILATDVEINSQGFVWGAPFSSFVGWFKLL